MKVQVFIDSDVSTTIKIKQLMDQLQKIFILFLFFIGVLGNYLLPCYHDICENYFINSHISWGSWIILISFFLDFRKTRFCKLKISTLCKKCKLMTVPLIHQNYTEWASNSLLHYLSCRHIAWLRELKVQKSVIYIL